jgi:hypothetical protein
MAKPNTAETMAKRKMVAALELEIAAVPVATEKLQELHKDLLEYESPFVISDLT